MSGAWRRSLGVGIPVAIFVAIALARWLLGAGATPAWLDRAAAISDLLAERGGSLLSALDPVEDPRVGPAAALISIGLSPPAVLVLFRCLAIAIGALVVGWLARSGGGFAGVAGAVLLALSPMWAEAARSADPYLALGAIFLLLGRQRSGRGSSIVFWLQVVLLGWSLTWTPWAWIALLPLPLAHLAAKNPRERIAAAIVPFAILAAFLIDPAALISPLRFAQSMLRQAAVAGLPSAKPPIGIAQGSWPIAGAIHVAGLLLLLYAARRWLLEVRSRDISPLIVVAIVALVAIARVPNVSPLLIALPWAASEAGRAADDLAPATLGRPAMQRRALIAVAVAVPLVWVQAQRIGRDQSRGDPGKEAIEWIETRVPAGGMIAYETGLRPPAQSAHEWVAIPFHSLNPSAYQGAYWPGWYRSFAAVVVQESRVRRLLRDERESGELLHFYVWLQGGSREQRVFGNTPGERVRAFVLPAHAGDAFDQGWRERVAAGENGGLPSAFLAALAAALAKSGNAGAAVDLLTEARTAGYDAPGIYVNLASALLELGRVNEAGRILDEASLKYPNSPEIQYNLGLALIRAGLWDRAIETLARVRRMWPKSGEAAYLLGYALANRGNRDAARYQLEEALRLDPNLPQRAAALALLDQLQGSTP